MEEAHAVQVVKINNHTFELDYDSLSDVLNKDEIRDRKVVVISVAGAFRKGKSFLLGFFLRYMYAQYEEKDATGWLENGDILDRGFSWRNGPDRETTGILMWSHIFLHDTPKDKIAIILLDTQGVYDNQSTAKDCAFIFALSTLLSSVQVYNLSMNIQETDLQHLQLFTEYGKMALEKSEHKPFQRLQFLVRDWSYAFTNAYGADGGRDVLDKVLKISPQQHEELRSVRKHIRSCFSEIECFLMPHPGLTVAQELHFHGELDNIDKNFKKYLKELVVLLLAPKNLKIKEINGQQIRAKDLVTYFGTYVKVLGGDDLPKPSTIMNATTEANHMVVASEARDLYVNGMKQICDSENQLSEEEFKAMHQQLLNQSLELFDSRKKMGSGSDISKKFRKKLISALEQMFDFYNQNNNNKIAKFKAEVEVKNLNSMEKSKELYKQEMNKLFAEHNYLLESEFEKKNAEVTDAAVALFYSQQVSGDSSFEQYKTKLLGDIRTFYPMYKTRNEDNRRIAEDAEEGEVIKSLHNAKENYSNRMENNLAGSVFLDEDDLREIHYSLRNLALTEFADAKHTSSQYYQKYKQRLEVDIDELFRIAKKRNTDHRKIKEAESDQMNIDADAEARKLYRNKVEELFRKTNDYISKKEMDSQHNNFKSASLSKFESMGDNKGKNYNHCLNSLKDYIGETYNLYARIRKEKQSGGCTIL